MLLWGRDRAALEEAARRRENTRYLPGCAFPATLSVEPDLARAATLARDLVIAVPSAAFRGVLTALRGALGPDSRVAWATKGFEQQTGLLPHQVAAEVLGADRPLAVLSGPTFASEVARGLPTALTVASADGAFAQDLAVALTAPNFRAYTSTDLTGVEVGGAVKNVLAIATGLADGMGYGANTRAALITRGLVEMTRLGVALGARAETFMGLAALGDLVLSCTDDQSRNRRFGLLLARGLDRAAAVERIGQVVEGLGAARAVHEVARREAIDLPICGEVYAVLYGGRSLASAVDALMQRDIKAEAAAAASA